MAKIKAGFKRIFGFIKVHKLSCSIVLIAVLVSAFFIWRSYSPTSLFEIPKLNLKEKPKQEARVRAPLSGVLVDPSLAKRRPIAIVVENHPDARPQSGLDKASLVYETLAEGGIVRFLAIFQENDAEIGPVRSARTQFVYWAKELEAIFAHVGGSDDALSLIKGVGVSDFNQFNYGNSFWRDTKRFAPHNVYTTTEKIRNGGKKAGYSEEKEIESFKFKEDEQKEQRPESQIIDIDISQAIFKVNYIFDKAENNYKRSLAGVPHTDKITSKQLRAKNIIIQFTTITDRSGSDTQVQAIGAGKIKYFLDGKSYEGTWKKKSTYERTKYLDSDGKEIVLNAGQTWIEVVRTGTNISVK